MAKKPELPFMLRSAELRMIDDAIAAGKLRRFPIFVGTALDQISSQEQRRRGSRSNFNRISTKNARKASVSLEGK